MKKLDIKSLKPEQVKKMKRDLKPIAKAYIYGVAEHVRSYKATLEALFAEAVMIIGVANVGDIVIESDGEFIVERDIKVLNAGNIQIYRGGKLIIDGGDLTLNAATIEVID